MGVFRWGALLNVPLSQVWEFVIKPENMHLWGPPTRPVTGIDRPFEAGDRVTIYRKDFFRENSQVLLVEQVVPYRSLHFRDLTPGAARMNVTATLSVEEAKDREATWIEEAIFYSLGNGWILQRRNIHGHDSLSRRSRRGAGRGGLGEPRPMGTLFRVVYSRSPGRTQ